MQNDLLLTLIIGVYNTIATIHILYFGITTKIVLSSVVEAYSNACLGNMFRLLANLFRRKNNVYQSSMKLHAAIIVV